MSVSVKQDAVLAPPRSKGGISPTDKQASRKVCCWDLTVQHVLVKKFGANASVTAYGRIFFSAAVKKVVAKVHKSCYYEFARYIKAVDTGPKEPGSGCLFTFVTVSSIKRTFVTVNPFLLTLVTFV